MRQQGFTLIEVMIVIVFVLTIGMIAIGATNGATSNNTISWGVNGVTEMRCIDSYKFVIGQHGQTRQVMDEFGKGVKCQ